MLLSIDHSVPLIMASTMIHSKDVFETMSLTFHNVVDQMILSMTAKNTIIAKKEKLRLCPRKRSFSEMMGTTTIQYTSKGDLKVLDEVE